MNLRATSLLVLLAAASACGVTVQYTPTNPSPRPLTARPAEMVGVFTTTMPDRPYVEIGIIQGRERGQTDGMPEIISEMRAEAGNIGCDAIIINGRADSTYSQGSTTSSATVDQHKVQTQTTSTSSSGTSEGFWGACIVYDEAAERAASIASPAPAAP